MAGALWLQDLASSIIGDDDSPLISEIEYQARGVLAGRTRVAQWQSLFFRQRELFRLAFVSLDRFRKHSDADHPAQALAVETQDILLDMRDFLRETRSALRERHGDDVELCLRGLRSRLPKLNDLRSRLEFEMDKVRCGGCGAWNPRHWTHCNQCGVTLDDGTVSLNLDEESARMELPDNYQRLWELAQAAMSQPATECDALEEHAQALAAVLLETEQRVQELMTDVPERRRRALVADLRRAREGLDWMAAFANHRDNDRLEQGWRQTLAAMAAFEEGLDEVS